MTFRLVQFLVFLLGHIPQSLAGYAGKGLGRLFYAIDKSHRRRALDNMKLAGYSSERAGVLTREVFENMGISLFEIMRIPWLGRADFERGYVMCEGREVLDKALARGKGVILLTAHLGNWELFSSWHAIMGYDMDVVVREMDNPLVARLMKWIRTCHGHNIVLKNRAMRRLLKTLAGGGIVAILLDQNVARVEGVFVDFFGVPACTNKGPAMLAAASGAAVIPTFISRKNGRHIIRIGPEIELSRGGDKKTDALENTRRFTAAIEEAIRRNPSQWFWVHRRWKTRPE